MRVSTIELFDFIHISLSDAVKNPAYWSFFENMFKEQLVRIAKRNYVVRMAEEYPKKNLPAPYFRGIYEETLVDKSILDTCTTGWFEKSKRTQDDKNIDSKFDFKLASKPDLKLAFIKERASNKKALEYAHIINTDWKFSQRDLKDAMFKVDLTKALRCKLIDGDDAATAILLRDSFKEITDEKNDQAIRRFDYYSGPFSLEKLAESIPHFGKAALAEFEVGIKSLSKEKRYYFTIDLAKKFEIAFLFYYLRRLNKNKNKRFLKLEDHFSKLTEIIQKFIKHTFDIDVELETLGSLIFQEPLALGKVMFEDHPYVKSLMADGNQGDSDITANMDPTFESFSLILASLFASEHRWWDISPNYDGTDTSPLICLMLPTISTFKQLQYALYGEDASDPHFVFGRFSLRYLRKLDEKPELFGSKLRLRAVELVHPDILHGDTPHGYKAFPISTAIHDFFYHLPHTSACPIKPFLSYMRIFFERERGFEMNKLLCDLIDIKLMNDPDFILYRKMESIIRDDKMDSLPLKLAKKKLIIEVLGVEAGADAAIAETSNLWESPQSTDNYLLIIIDMILNKETWKNILGEYPLDFFASYYPVLNQHAVEWKNLFGKIFEELFKFNHHYVAKHENTIDFSKFFLVFHEMEKVINSATGKPTWFYIVLYRLKGHPGSLKLCEAIFAHDLKSKKYLKILKWNLNKGLSIRESLTTYKENNISKFESKELFAALMTAYANAAKNIMLIVGEKRLPDSIKNSTWIDLANRGYTDLVLQLWKSREKDPYINKNDPLHITSFFGFLPLIRYLYEDDKLININSRDTENHTPIYLAAKQNKLLAVQYLLRLKADIATCFETKPLSLIYKNQQLIRLLTESKSNAEFKDCKQSSLALFTTTRSEKIVKILRTQSHSETAEQKHTGPKQTSTFRSPAELLSAIRQKQKVKTTKVETQQSQFLPNFQGGTFADFSF